MSSRPKPAPSILQVKITLRGVTKPPVWRRVLVPSDIRLDRFHEVIQAAMGWTDTHLHVFCTELGDYGVPDPELGFRDEHRTTLGALLQGPGDQIRYTYDFGDDWEHAIRLEKIVPADPDRLYPSCAAGKSACPPEDCGGRWGYTDLRGVLADPGHEEHEGMLEWLELEDASEFDPGAFDLEEVNDSLAFFATVPSSPGAASGR
jgi:hypothetical protein